MKVKLAIVGDVHLSDVQVTSRLDNYNEAIFSKLRHIIDYCSDKGISTICFLGDLFHRKSAQQTTHQTISRLISIFGDFKGDIYTIIGNHDYNGTIESFDKQPLYVLQAAGVLEIIADSHVSLTSGFPNVVIYGLSHNEVNDEKLDNYNLLDKDLNTSNFNILLTHQWIFEDGVQFFGNYLNYENLKDLHFDVVVNGHYHPAAKEQQVYGKTFFRPGAICRVSSSKEDLAIEPRFLVLEIDTDELTHFNKPFKYHYEPIPFAPADKVFDMTVVKNTAISKEEISKFTKSLQAASIEKDVDVNSVDSIVNLLSSIQSDSEVLSMCKSYLEKAKEGLQ